MKLKQAENLANDFIFELRPWFDRAEIAGSIRRKSPEPKDIEIVVIPTRSQVGQTKNLFGEVIEDPYRNDFEYFLDYAEYQGESWAWMLDTETPRDGPKYKRLRHRETGICMDLYLTTPAGWGICYTLRTGPGDFSQALVTLALRQGRHVYECRLHDHPKVKNKPCPKSTECPLILPTLEEGDFFEALGLPWIDPQARKAELVWQYGKQGMLS